MSTEEVAVKTSSALDQALVKILEQVTSGVDTSVTFLQEQIPDVIQQLLAWHFAINLIKFGIWVGGMAGMVLAVVKVFKYISKEVESYDKVPLRALSLGGFVFGSLFWSVIFCNFVWLQIWIAPKLFLIEYAAHLVK